MRQRFSLRREYQLAFTLIELLIVVAIIAILAAIAVPNFLEAQTRSKVSRAKSDMRALSTAIEAYSVDNNQYPDGTDSVAGQPDSNAAVLGPLAAGYYGFRTRGSDGQIAGIDFFTLTTPIPYINSIPADPFPSLPSPIQYSYRNAKSGRDGWILTSVGPDSDLLAPNGKGNNDASNPISTAADSKSPSRLGDINENAVIAFIEGTSAEPRPVRARLEEFLIELSYDPTNGTVSGGDLYRKVGSPK